MQRRNFLISSLCFASAASAELNIEIDGVGSVQIPVLLHTMDGDRGLSDELLSVIRADLESSRLFKVLESPTRLSVDAPPDYNAWRGQRMQGVLVASVQSLTDGRFEVKFRVYDANKNAVLGGMVYSASINQKRRTAHRIADFIYEKLLGRPGTFSTRLALVSKQAKQFRLMIADADGHETKVLFASSEPIMSPMWSPNGKHLAYVSFHTRKPVVYVADLAKGGSPLVLANFKGSNSSPAWSPDGTRLAVVLSKSGLQQVYLINADGSNLVRLTQSNGIDTDPCFSADGKFVYFSSDRTGSPQIYRIPVTGGKVERITFKGDYNTKPRISPDGKLMCYITRRGGYRLAVMELESGEEQILSKTQSDDAPSFAPNSHLLIYETQIAHRGVVSVVSVDGLVHQTLRLPRVGDVRDPAWAPFSH